MFRKRTVVLFVGAGARKITFDDPAKKRGGAKFCKPLSTLTPHQLSFFFPFRGAVTVKQKNCLFRPGVSMFFASYGYSASA